MQIARNFKSGIEVISSPIDCELFSLVTNPFTIVKINGNTIEIGMTGVLFLDNIIINSIIFQQDTDYSFINIIERRAD